MDNIDYIDLAQLGRLPEEGDRLYHQRPSIGIGKPPPEVELEIVDVRCESIGVDDLPRVQGNADQPEIDQSVREQSDEPLDEHFVVNVEDPDGDRHQTRAWKSSLESRIADFRRALYQQFKRLGLDDLYVAFVDGVVVVGEEGGATWMHQPGELRSEMQKMVADDVQRYADFLAETEGSTIGDIDSEDLDELRSAREAFDELHDTTVEQIDDE